MARKWRDIRGTFSPEREAKIKRWVEAELAKLPIAEVRQARQMTQVRLAEILGVNQGAISKLEKRSDMYLSTLRSYIEAMGGQLEIRAVFPDGEIMIEQFGEIGREVPVKRSEAISEAAATEPVSA
jgi:transcriptional regulator with XRE-family HTH domain